MSTLEPQPDEAGAQPVAPPVPKARKALSRLKRELSDDELSSPGVQKLLVEELERVEEEKRELEKYRDKYHTTDRQVAVLEEKLKRTLAGEVLSSGCLTIGAAALGYAPAVWSAQPTGWIALAFGVVLVAVGTLARVVRL